MSSQTLMDIFSPIAEADDDIETIVSSLPISASLAGYRLNPVEFEKDDANHRIDFIATKQFRCIVASVSLLCNRGKPCTTSFGDIKGLPLPII